jgi:hypothetical protein
MHRAILMASAIGALILATTPANRATAMTPAAPSEFAPAAWNAHRIHKVDFVCDWRCTRRWPPQQYWQWDERPIWDDPWSVLRPNFWGSPEPHLVPADHWAHKWHPPWIRYWHTRHAQ